MCDSLFLSFKFVVFSFQQMAKKFKANFYKLQTPYYKL